MNEGNGGGELAASGSGHEPMQSGEAPNSYEVGRGKPPKHSRFKPGNKFGKGRPKGAKNLGTIVNEALSTKVHAKINGKTQKLTKGELALHQLANKASAGDLKAIAKVIELQERYGPAEPQDVISPEEASADRETLRDYYRTYGQQQANEAEQ